MNQSKKNSSSYKPYKKDDESKSLNVIDVMTEEKEIKATVANITHKNSFGANNWKKFMELSQNKKGNHSTKVAFFKKHSTETTNTPTVSESSVNSEAKLHSKIKSRKKQHYSDSKSFAKMEFKGTRPNSISLQDKNKLNPRNGEPCLTKRIAMDCEMVGVEIGVNKSMLARISLVNSHGDCIYDKYVKPTEPVLDYRTRFSGIRANDLKNAVDFKIVQKEVAELIKGRIIIGHALRNDFKVLFLSHPKHLIRDTSKFQKFRDGKTPALKKLAKKYLGVIIQEGEHNSVEDALAAMQLYNMFKKEWESSIFSKKYQTKKCKKSQLSELGVDSSLRVQVL